MTNGKTLCLNMIVRNEMANLERCLSALVDQIQCWVIGDTGSTDGTQDFIKAFFAARNKPGELHSFPFENFEQARNAALDCAYASTLSYDYLLFADADMELVVDENIGIAERLSGAAGYRLLQRANSGLAYWNTRLVQRRAGARYHGVTHEYIDVPGGVQELKGVWYKDHASGSNRPDKFDRDIALLSQALERDPGNSRYWYYLAQSYRDRGRTADAARTYAKRAEMGGWEEEVWHARLQEARCLRGLGDEAAFVRQALAAFNLRPGRAEPLYDLARFYREKGMNDASVLFSEAGLTIKKPEDDILFLEDFVYTTGLQEEYSIAANYSRDPQRKDRGFAACNWLALNRSVPESTRDLAWSNLYFYADRMSAILPSFAARPIGFTPPAGYRVLNPSVTRVGPEIVVLQRTVNYTMTEDGLQYQTPDDAPIHTRNFLVRLSAELEIQSSAEVLPPVDMPEPVSSQVRGFEDLRVFAIGGQLWGCATFRELTPEAWCEQVLVRIEETGLGSCRLADWRVLSPEGPRVHEKNWMPQVAGDRLRFVYLCDPTRVVDDRGHTVSETTPAIAARNFRGGSQLIGFDDGWLALIHEVHWRPADRRRFYLHRFVWFDKTDRLRRVSRPFFFNAKGVEFAAGLAWHPDGKRLLISYSVSDRESWIATVDAAEVAVVLEDVEDLNSAVQRQPQAGIGGSAMPAEPELTQGDAPSHSRDQALPASRAAGTTVEDLFLDMAPFLRAVDSPSERRRLSRDFDRRIEPVLDAVSPALPQIHCFYEILSDKGDHRILAAATASMRAAGHPVRMWSYSPHKLDFLRVHGVEVLAADDVVPRAVFDQVMAGSEIRYFSDIFRYAVLYEHGGLWMDSDVILLRPFPFRGDYFLNLQWRGGHKGHFVCGNVMYAKPYSHHFRTLYEASIERVLDVQKWEFGAVGPKLLSDYVASDMGAELRAGLFSPMFFNSIDWTETDRFDKPLSELGDYLNDDRVFGVHLWTARSAVNAGSEVVSLGASLADPLTSFPAFTGLADRFNTDKNRHTGNRHSYARIYDRLLADRRFSMRRLMEIGLCRGLAEGNQTETPSVALWQSYFPFCQVIGVDLTDFSRLNSDRFISFVCDQSKPDDLRAVARRLEPGSLDVIIDDGSHASFDQQLTLIEFFPLLAEGGWYFIEDLDWQPPGEDAEKIALTKNLLREIQLYGRARAADPLGVSDLAAQMAEIRFFDSHYELGRAKLLGGLVAIRKGRAPVAGSGGKHRGDNRGALT
jgi:glycosyltransferase involved in cell wall biosynthesis